MFNKLITTCALAFLAMLSCGADEPVPSGTPDKEGTGSSAPQLSR